MSQEGWPAEPRKRFKMITRHDPKMITRNDSKKAPKSSPEMSPKWPPISRKWFNKRRTHIWVRKGGRPSLGSASKWSPDMIPKWSPEMIPKRHQSHHPKWVQNDPQSRENDLINAGLIFESRRLAGRATQVSKNDQPKWHENDPILTKKLFEGGPGWFGRSEMRISRVSGPVLGLKPSQRAF